jgi:FkbM family methyltransferase
MKNNWLKRQVQLDMWEVILLVGFVVAGAGAAYRAIVPAHPELSASEIEYFRAKYGPHHYSEREEEWMIRDFFQDKRGGVFVDVGANHYQRNSKTYYLEANLGWSGLAIEPQEEFADGYAQNRPNTRFLPFFVSDESNRLAELYIAKRSTLVASADRDFVRQFKPKDEPDVVRQVPTITLNDLLKSEGIERIDFLSMDIELHEPQALKGFDIGRFRPALVCIEGLLPVRQKLLDYFTRNGYVLLGKYMWVDRENLYFAPLAEPRIDG